MTNKAPWEPKTIQEMVDEMLTEALRLSGGDQKDAAKHLIEIAEKVPEIKEAIAHWYVARYVARYWEGTEEAPDEGN